MLGIPLIVWVAAVALVVVGLVALVYKVEDKLIAERRKAQALAKLLGQYGHVIAVDMCQSFAIGDLASVLAEVEDTLDDLQDPTKGPAMLQADLANQIAAQLAMPSCAPAVVQAVAGFLTSPANAAVVKTAGLAVTAIAI